MNGGETGSADVRLVLIFVKQVTGVLTCVRVTVSAVGGASALAALRH